MLKQTVLNAAHRALGARMVDFGGWDMPVNYGSQIEEHHAVRRNWGIFDVSHMCPVDLVGPDSRAFLSRLIANDVAKLKTPGKALYSAMLNDAGGVVDDLIVYWRGGDAFRIVVNAGTADKDIAWMQAHLADWQLDASLNARRDFAMIAAQGPEARAKVAALLGANEALLALIPFSATDLPATAYGDLFVARTGYTGEDGFEIMVPSGQAEALWQALVAAGAAPCGLGARDTLRLEAGMNLYGQDMDDNVSPLDAGLAWTVAMTDERNFVGRAALTINGQKMQFLGLVLLDKGVLRGHQKVVCPQGAGEITSGSFSPTLQKSIALARLPLGVQVGDTVEVEIRDKRLPAQVVKPVFARNGQALI